MDNKESRDIKMDSARFNMDTSRFRKCVATIAEDEFRYYAIVAMSAVHGTMPLKNNPGELGFKMIDERSGQMQCYQIKDMPFTRFTLALLENMSEEEREEKLPAISTRLLALIRLIDQGSIIQLEEANSEDVINTMLDAMVRTASRAPLDVDLNFNSESFRPVMDEILRAI